MVQTTTFSAFPSDTFVGGDIPVGLDGGANTQFTTSWTTGTRPFPPAAGMFGYNTTTNNFEFYNGTMWVALGGNPFIVKNITCTFTLLASGGKVNLIAASSGSAQYQILNLFMNSGGTNFSGGGGNRLGQVSDGTTQYTLIPAANMQALTNAAWGSTPVPFPASAAIDTFSVAGQNIFFSYSGGSVDYTAGSVVITIVAIQVA